MTTADVYLSNARDLEVQIARLRARAKTSDHPDSYGMSLVMLSARARSFRKRAARFTP